MKFNTHLHMTLYLHVCLSSWHFDVSSSANGVHYWQRYSKLLVIISLKKRKCVKQFQFLIFHTIAFLPKWFAENQI